MTTTINLCYLLHFVVIIIHLVDESNDAADGSDRRENDDSGNQDINMQYDDQNAGGQQDDTSNSNGNGLRNMDVDDVDRGNDSHNNERDRINPFSNRNRNNFNNDSRDSPAVIVNTNLLPFIQKLRDPLRM